MAYYLVIPVIFVPDETDMIFVKNFYPTGIFGAKILNENT